MLNQVYRMFSAKETKIAVIGLGYVGLPLAVEFGRHFSTRGFDLNIARVTELIAGVDSTLEVSPEELQDARQLRFTADPADIASCTIFIVAVPTPIDASKRPNFHPLISASETVGRVLKKNDIVIYESTVYPGATEEVCVPILEKVSSLRFNSDFYCGYSPERINPGDKMHRLPNIVKITSGSTPEIAQFVDQLYKTIITAGTFPASSIKVAEAAKVIENTQRDVNIALINELSLIFNKLGINTLEVLKAAETKWNFLPFRPGLVGGHCIGVDPYYLTHKAQEVGYQPDMILAGRRINDQMGRHIAANVIKLMAKKGIDTSKAKILLLGLTFKENCPDLRNTKVIDIISELQDYGIEVDVHDPWVTSEAAHKEYGISLQASLVPNTYDGIVIAVAHRQFAAMTASDLRRLCREKSIIFDVKNIRPVHEVDGCL